MPFRIVRNDITKMHTEAIVNTANEYVSVGTGCDSAVYKAAGYDKLLKYRKEKIGFVPEGGAFITPGFNLEARYIIHAVSPRYMGGDQGEEEKLRSCYRKSLQIAKENSIKSISFPLISTGGFGYPKEEGMRIAVDEMNAFLLSNEMDIFLVVFDTKATQLGEKIYPGLEAYIDQNYVKEARKKEYGDAYVPIRQSELVYDAYLPNAQRMEGRQTSTLKRKRQRNISRKKFDKAINYVKVMRLHALILKNSTRTNYHPNKLTALCLCVGAKLNLDESKDLLARAGYALSPCDETDIIFSYFIENEIYDMIELDIQLEEHGLPCIIS